MKVVFGLMFWSVVLETGFCGEGMGKIAGWEC